MSPRDKHAEKILALGRNNKKFPADLPQDCLKAVFESGRTFGLFTAYFDKELYNHAAASSGDKLNRSMYTVLAVTKVLEDVEISRCNHTSYRDMQRFLEQDFTTIRDDAQIPEKFKPYVTARIDIKLMTAAGDLEILSLSDEKANVDKPDWFQKNGVGYVIHSYAGNLELVIKSNIDGQISLNLRGKDVRNPKDKTKCIPYWIDYTKFILNEKRLFDMPAPVCYDEALSYDFEIKAGEEIKIQVEWLPHRSDT